jgi:hypothetical protein
MVYSCFKDHDYETMSNYTHLDDIVLMSKSQTKKLPENIKKKQISHKIIWNQNNV